GAAANPLPGGDGQLDLAPSGGPRVRQQAPVEARPAAAQASRGRTAEEVSRIAFAATTAVAAGVAFAFLLLPLLAIFLRVPIGDLFDQLGSPVFRDALVVSLKTS